MAENILAAFSNQLTETVAAVGKSVVTVHGRRHPSSGILFTSDSMVTSSHALRREEDIAITLGPGLETTARLAGRDPGTDLAVLRLAEPVITQLPRWAESSGLRVGEFVLALARTWRGNIVASSGILSGVIDSPWRTWSGGEIDQFLRPDLSLYPGFAGGPLSNAQGEILGMTSGALHRGGITVPSATIKRIAAELLESGQVKRPYLGLAMQSIALPESLHAKLNLKGTEGLLIAHIESGSPAEKAGVLLGDILVELQGVHVADTEAVQDVLRKNGVGNTIEAALVRAGSLVKMTIKLEARPTR